jgi:hypothetical protein
VNDLNGKEFAKTLLEESVDDLRRRLDEIGLSRN